MTTTIDAADELQMLTINDIKGLLKVSRNTAYARTRETEFPLPYVIGGQYRWPAIEVRGWIAKQRATSRDIAPTQLTRRPAPKAKKPTVAKDAPLPAPRPVAKRINGGEAA